MNRRELEGKLAAKLPNDLKETIVTTGRSWTERGRQQGLEQGLKDGRAEQLVRQLEHRFGGLPVELRERIAAATTELLDAWEIKLLDARALAEVFAT